MANRQTNRTNASDSYNRFLQSGYYSHSSQAYQLAEPYPEFEEESPEAPPAPARPARRPAPAQPSRRPAPARKPARREKVQRGTKTRTVYEIDLQKKRAISLTTGVLIAVLFLGALSCVAAKAYVDQKYYQLATAQSSLRSLQRENASLQDELLKAYDLTAIKELAITKLNMCIPADYQMIHVSVPRTSYSVQYDATISTASME